MSDYIAVCRFSLGGGSWARASTADEAVAECLRMVKADWSSSFKLPPSLKIALYDVEGHDEVTMGIDGVWGGEDADAVRIPLMEVREVEL